MTIEIYDYGDHKKVFCTQCQVVVIRYRYRKHFSPEDGDVWGPGRCTCGGVWEYVNKEYPDYHRNYIKKMELECRMVNQKTGKIITPGKHGGIPEIDVAKKQEQYVEMSKTILRQKPIITSMGQEIMYFYDGGIYHNYGSGYIKKLINEWWGSGLNKHDMSEIIAHLKWSTMERMDIFDQNPYKLHLENGIYDIDTKEFIPHSPEYPSLVMLPVKFEKSKDCPMIKKFLSEILYEKDIPMIQELLGYVLLRDYRYQYAFMFIGGGANGKGQLIQVFEKFLGKDNTSSATLQKLTVEKFASSLLHGKFANISGDLSKDDVKQTGLFKMLTGGDKISAEIKYGEQFDFFNYAKLIFSCNEVPKFDDESAGFYRRWFFITFPNTFDAENRVEDIGKKISTESEISGLFNWALEGLDRLMKNHDFTNSKSTDVVRDHINKLKNPMKSFINEYYYTDGGREEKGVFYDRYKEYCIRFDLPYVTKRNVKYELSKIVNGIEDKPMNIDGKTKRVWMGISLKKGTVAGYDEPTPDEREEQANGVRQMQENRYANDFDPEDW